MAKYDLRENLCSNAIFNIGIKAGSHYTDRKQEKVFLYPFSYSLKNILLLVLYFVITIWVVFDKN